MIRGMTLRRFDGLVRGESTTSKEAIDHAAT